jgi:hypothetical protein
LLPVNFFLSQYLHGTESLAPCVTVLGCKEKAFS